MPIRPIWNGTISFGLVAIPVTLYSAEVTERAHFHLLDKSNHARIRYERINDTTGKKVAWENIVKAYEFEKNNYVIIDEELLEKTEDKNFKTIDIQEFLDNGAIEYPFFSKPYYLIPSKGGEKGYFLLLETLERMKKVAVAKFVIKTKQYIGIIAPYHHTLLLNELRYFNEIRNPLEVLPEKSISKGKVSSDEIKIAEQLVSSMSSKWNPKKYHDRSQEILEQAISKKIKKGKTYEATLSSKKKKKETKIIDFMELLKKSIKEKDKKKSKKTARKK